MTTPQQPTSLQQTPAGESLAVSIHRVAGIGAAGGGALLSRLAAVFAAGETGALRGGAIASLAETLNAGDEPAALLNHILPRVPLLHPYRHQKESDWRWGSFGERVRLVNELYTSARAAQGGTPDAVRYSRAAVLLAVQERFITGPAPALRLLEEADFAMLSGWPPKIMSQLAGIAQAESSRSAVFAAAVMTAATALQRVFTDFGGRLGEQQYDAVVSSLSTMARVAPHRPDVQWRLANFVWRLANLARASGSSSLTQRLRDITNQWKPQVGDPVFDRWIEEAFAEQAEIRTPGISIISAEALAARTVH